MRENLQMFKLIGIIGIVVVVVVLVAIGPLAVIWAWNTLFGAALTVPYTIATWLAVLIIGVFLRSEVTVAKKK
jgi:hypothetical protein